MGRIRTGIQINGRDCWTLFDSGARNNYIVPIAVSGNDLKDLPVRRTTGLGGKEHQVDQSCHVFAKVEGHWVELHAGVVDEIGRDEDGKPIEVLFGALSMQEWGIRLDVPNERLDLSLYSTNFVEF